MIGDIDELETVATCPNVPVIITDDQGKWLSAENIAQVRSLIDILFAASHPGQVFDDIYGLATFERPYPNAADLPANQRVANIHGKEYAMAVGRRTMFRAIIGSWVW